MFHNLKYSASIYFSYVLFLEVSVEIGVVEGIGVSPLDLVLLGAVGMGEDLFTEGTLVVVVFLGYLLFVALEVGILDGVEVGD